MLEKEISRLHQVHLGKILSNFTILFAIVLLLTAAAELIQGIATFFAMIAMLFVAMILLLSLFSLYSWFQSLHMDTWLSPDGSFTTFFETIKSVLNTACPYIFVATVIFSALSIFLLLRDKNDKHIGRIVFAGIAIVLGVIAMIVSFGVGGK